MCYDDLEPADLIVLVGSNTAWCHPVLLQRMLAAREQRPALKIVVLDPRRTATMRDRRPASAARAPAPTCMLFNGLLAWLAEHGHVDRDFVDAHTNGFDAALQAARAAGGDLAALRRRPAGSTRRLLQQFFELFAAHRAVDHRVLAGREPELRGHRQGERASSTATCHGPHRQARAPGRSRSPGSRMPWAGAKSAASRTRWPRTSISRTRPAARPCSSSGAVPRIASKQGPKAVEMFDRIHDGRIKAVWIMATNPVVSLPDADKVRAALAALRTRRRLRLSWRNTDTAALAHVLAAGARLGREGRHGHELRADDFAAARVPAAARRGARGLAHHLRRRARHGIRRVRLRLAARDLPRARATHRRMPTTAGARWTSARGRTSRRSNTGTGSRPRGPWPILSESARGPMFGDGKFQHPDGQGAFRRR